MVHWCRLGKGECDGCGECREKPMLEDVYGQAIYIGDHYYSIDGVILAEKNLMKWAMQYRRNAGDM